jgi:hypothetical protein
MYIWRYTSICISGDISGDRAISMCYLYRYRAINLYVYLEIDLETELSASALSTDTYRCRAPDLYRYISVRICHLETGLSVFVYIYIWRQST